MGECPFCGSAVTDDLVTYGGTCPRCFAEIPGEEAATDPGVEVKAAQELRDHRWAMMRRVAALSVMLAVVGCTGVVAMAMVLWPEPEVAELLDFDTLDFPMPDIVSGETKPSRPRPRTPKPEPDTTPSAPGNDGVASSERGLRTELNPVSSELGGNGGLTRPAGVADLSLEAPKVRRDDNVVLSDPGAIRDMIGERMVEFIPGLNQCYERQLKLSPSLRGRWQLQFTVAKDGGVNEASVTALERGHAEFERCLTEHVRTYWRFGKITENQPIRKTLRFSPG